MLNSESNNTQKKCWRDVCIQPNEKQGILEGFWRVRGVPGSRAIPPNCPKPKVVFINRYSIGIIIYK